MKHIITKIAATFHIEKQEMKKLYKTLILQERMFLRIVNREVVSQTLVLDVSIYVNRRLVF